MLLARYGSIEKFANFAVEGMVGVGKRNQEQATQNFGGLNNSPANLAAQHLHLNQRRDWRVGKKLLEFTSRRKTKSQITWAVKELELNEEFQRKYGVQHKSTTQSAEVSGEPSGQDKGKERVRDSPLDLEKKKDLLAVHNPQAEEGVYQASEC